ncbi:MAG: amidase family protein, partial [Parvibaculales bacterium]
ARYDGVRYGARQQGVDIDDMYAQTRAAGFGDEVKRRVMIGTYALSAGYYDAYYVKALQVRRLIAEDFTKAYEKCDVLLTPTTPSAAFAVGKNVEDPLEMYLNDVFTVTVNLAGLPGISIPAGVDGNGLPLGLQLIGQAFGEETLLRAGDVMEQAAGFTARPNEWWSA